MPTRIARRRCDPPRAPTNAHFASCVFFVHCSQPRFTNMVGLAVGCDEGVGSVWQAVCPYALCVFINTSVWLGRGSHSCPTGIWVCVECVFHRNTRTLFVMGEGSYLPLHLPISVVPPLSLAQSLCLTETPRGIKYRPISVTGARRFASVSSHTCACVVGDETNAHVCSGSCMSLISGIRNSFLP